MNDPIAMLRADIDPIARAGLEKATELGNNAIAAATKKKAKAPKRRKWWLGPLLALIAAGVVFAVKRSQESSMGGGDSYQANGARLGVTDSAPDPAVADAR